MYTVSTRHSLSRPNRFLSRVELAAPDAAAGTAGPGVIVDETATNLVSLRRTIYLTIQSALDFEEAAHKLLKMQLKPGQEVPLLHSVYVYLLRESI